MTTNLLARLCEVNRLKNVYGPAAEWPLRGVTSGRPGSICAGRRPAEFGHEASVAGTVTRTRGRPFLTCKRPFGWRSDRLSRRESFASAQEPSFQTESRSPAPSTYRSELALALSVSTALELTHQLMHFMLSPEMPVGHDVEQPSRPRKRCPPERDDDARLAGSQPFYDGLSDVIRLYRSSQRCRKPFFNQFRR